MVFQNLQSKVGIQEQSTTHYFRQITGLDMSGKGYKFLNIRGNVNGLVSPYCFQQLLNDIQSIFYDISKKLEAIVLHFFSGWMEPTKTKNGRPSHILFLFHFSSRFTNEKLTSTIIYSTYFFLQQSHTF